MICSNPQNNIKSPIKKCVALFVILREKMIINIPKTTCESRKTTKRIFMNFGGVTNIAKTEHIKKSVMALGIKKFNNSDFLFFSISKLISFFIYNFLHYLDIYAENRQIYKIISYII